jgi:hypothetical protein
LFPLFSAGVIDTGGKLLPVSLIPAANLPPVSTSLAKLVAKFAAGVTDTEYLRQNQHQYIHFVKNFSAGSLHFHSGP